MAKNDQIRLLDTLLENEEKKSWPYEQNVAFVEEINLKRRIQQSSHPLSREKVNVVMSKQNSNSDLRGVWISETVVVLPILVLTCVVLLVIIGFGCFLIIVAKIRTKNQRHSNPIIDSKPFDNDNFPPKTSAIILQNKRCSPKNQLIRHNVKFAPLPRTRELCELDYFKPCNCKRQMVTVQL
jgi:hypothetical protein